MFNIFFVQYTVSLAGYKCTSTGSNQFLWTVLDNLFMYQCLWSPESLDLSLLIQNKGTKPLSVKISAPDYVHLENNSVHLPEKENQKVKVSIGKGSKDALIVLTVKDANCIIDFKDLSLHSIGTKTDKTVKPQLSDMITKVPSFVLISVVTAMLVASVWMCIRFRRKQLTSEGSKYQKLETELPVSGGGKKESDDGWDESWGDSWDDEEAPKTPSLPITPSLSSKGLASRKLSKDAWKD
ncbi:transmembrane protein [Thalictrum thalictroides]|uniref:Transmembrane protein n=1 Tax=Thalictrum thalictroides TaxID=46969 RepID=A0A7J6WFJ2_THATH|nr:transmembrane protein [Thalictrum thalictroides]